MKGFQLKSLFAGALIGAGVFFAIAATFETRTPREYQIAVGNPYSGELRDRMNKLGSNNWEFVATSALDHPSAYAIFERKR